MRLCMEHGGEGGGPGEFCLVLRGRSRETSRLKKKKEKLLPNGVEQEEEELGAHKSLPCERERGGHCFVIVRCYLLLPV